jgi:hypothetical protein
MYLTMGEKRRLEENLKLGEKSATYNFTKKRLYQLVIKRRSCGAIWRAAVRDDTCGRRRRQNEE